MRHARVSLLLLRERAGEDAFKYGIFNFVRVGGGSDFSDAIGPPLPLIRPSFTGWFLVLPIRAEGMRTANGAHHLLLTHFRQIWDHQAQQPGRHIIHQLHRDWKVPEYMRQSKIPICRAKIPVSPIFRV